MKLITTRSYYLLLILPVLLSIACQTEKKEGIILKNDLLEIRFDPLNGFLNGIKYGLKPVEVLDETINDGSIWEIEFLSDEGSETISSSAAGKYLVSEHNSSSIIMEWSDFTSVGWSDLKVRATVNLEDDKPMSNWGITVEGTKGMNIKQLIYPKITGIKDIGDEYLAVPYWLGQLFHEPRMGLMEKQRASLQQNMGKQSRYDFTYPGPMALQMVALYDKNNYGVYLACNDTAAFSKSFSFTMDEEEQLSYEMLNYPAMDEKLNHYTPSYQSIVGFFNGDWITAAETYRQWAKEQVWCRDSRLANNLIEPWLKETAIWVWNRTTSDKVLEPAIHLKKLSNLSVNVFWHWWHKDSYDDSFPEYLPPREGGDRFVKAMKKANDNGVNAIVYMNSFQWGTETESWDTEGAEQHAVKDINGNLRSHVYNIFTGKSLTNMCMGTDFWKNKYATLSDSVVNVFKTNGVYMDQACLHRRCYDPAHGHAIGGGNYWVTNFGKLTQMIRERTRGANNAVLAGEGASEAWLPYLDAFLTLQVSMERYAGVSNRQPIPFYPMVYHKYAVMYGSYSSLLVPPYDNLWPEEYAPQEPEALLSEKFNKQFYMEHARSFVWGQQPTLANYRSFLPEKRKHEIEYFINLAKVRMQALKYLLYGEMQRSPDMAIPREEIDISRLSIYAGKTGNSVTAFKSIVPVVYSGAWKAEDGNLGIAITNISEGDFDVNIMFKASDYDLSSSGEIYLINKDGKKPLSSYKDGEIIIAHKLGPRGACLVEIIPD